MTRAGLDAILATLHIVLAGMVEMSAVCKGEVAQLQPVLQPHDGATERDQQPASDFEVFYMLLFFHLFCKSDSHLRIRYMQSLGYSIWIFVCICIIKGYNNQTDEQLKEADAGAAATNEPV